MRELSTMTCNNSHEMLVLAPMVADAGVPGHSDAAGRSFVMDADPLPPLSLRGSARPTAHMAGGPCMPWSCDAVGASRAGCRRARPQRGRQDDAGPADRRAVRPTAGQLRVHGYDLAHERALALRRLGVALTAGRSGAAGARSGSACCTAANSRMAPGRSCTRAPPSC